MALRLVILVLILATNGFFAAAEVSLVSVRQSRMKELAEQGHAGAQSALSLLANPGRLLSVTQVGVTLASLGVGWAGEETLYTLFEQGLTALHLHVAAPFLRVVAFALAFLIISYAHVIVGEVVPKNLAIEKADRLAVVVAPVLLVFYKLSQPFVFVVERTAAIVSRALGVSGEHAHGGHSPEELKYIIRSIRHEGRLEQFEEDAIQNLLELSEYNAREIMTPRNRIISLPVDADLETVMAVMAEHQFTRMPVYEGRPEHIVGVVHYKDLIRTWEDRRNNYDRRRPARPFRLRRFVRKPLVVPETKPLNQLVDEFRDSHTRMALVVDEFGTVAGVVTLDDLMQQIFGAVSDEHDVIVPSAVTEEQNPRVEGSTTIRELQTRYGIELPSEAGFETLAGFILFQLGHIPRPKESVTYGDRKFTVEALDKNRIRTVCIEKIDPPLLEDSAANA